MMRLVSVDDISKTKEFEKSTKVLWYIPVALSDDDSRLLYIGVPKEFKEAVENQLISFESIDFRLTYIILFSQRHVDDLMGMIKDCMYYFSNGPYVFNLKESELILSLIKKTEHLIKTFSGNSEQFYSVATQLVLCKIKELGASQLSSELQMKMEFLRKLEEHLINSPADKLKVKELAESLHFGQKKLAQLTGELFGKSPLELVHQIKLAKAKKMLTTTNLSIKQVAYELGFTNPDYFSVFFKKHIGLSPKKFKEGNHS